MKIYILSGPYEGNSYTFDYDVVVGRDPSVDLSLPLDISISRKHLKLSTTPNSIIIEDLNSTNGTFILDQRKMTKLIGKKEINTNNVYLKIGNTVIEVCL